MLPRRDLFSSMLPKWHALLQTDLRMLVFSGEALLSGCSCTFPAPSLPHPAFPLVLMHAACISACLWLLSWAEETCTAWSVDMRSVQVYMP